MAICSPSALTISVSSVCWLVTKRPTFMSVFSPSKASTGTRHRRLRAKSRCCSRDPFRLLASRHLSCLDRRGDAMGGLTWQHARLQQPRHLRKVADRLERFQTFKQRCDLIVSQRSTGTIFKLFEQLVGRQRIVAAACNEMIDATREPT